MSSPWPCSWENSSPTPDAVGRRGEHPVCLTWKESASVTCSHSCPWCLLWLALGMAELRAVLLLLFCVSLSSAGECAHCELWGRQGRELPWQLKWSLPSREGSSALDTMHWRWGSGKAVNCGEWMETTVASAVLQTDPRGASMIRKVQPEAMDLSDREAGSRGDFPCSQPQPALHCRAGPRCNYC